MADADMSQSQNFSFADLIFKIRLKIQFLALRRKDQIENPGKLSGECRISETIMYIAFDLMQGGYVSEDKRDDSSKSDKLPVKDLNAENQDIASVSLLIL